MTRSPEETEEQQPWKVLSEAGLVEIRLDEFSERIQDVKRIVIGRLRELLDFETARKERESAAYSLGTLKGLELKVLANAPPPDPSEM
jgi:3-dehydroquinate dehydratase